MLRPVLLTSDSEWSCWHDPMDHMRKPGLQCQEMKPPSGVDQNILSRLCTETVNVTVTS